MTLTDDATRYSLIYFLERTSDATDAFGKCLADVRADGVLLKVERPRSDDGGESVGGYFGDMCRQQGIQQEFTNAKSPIGAKRRCR